MCIVPCSVVQVIYILRQMQTDRHTLRQKAGQDNHYKQLPMYRETTKLLGNYAVIRAQRSTENQLLMAQLTQSDRAL